MMRWLVSYDIVDDRQRQRLARLLEGWGVRVQYSVFECELSPQELRNLRELLQHYVEEGEDSLRWYPLCRSCLGRASQLGKGLEPGEGGDYHLL